MLWIAIRMLTGDAQKFYGLVFGIAFSTLLITQQLTIFVNLIERGASGVGRQEAGLVISLRGDVLGDFDGPAERLALLAHVPRHERR